MCSPPTRPTQTTSRCRVFRRTRRKASPSSPASTHASSHSRCSGLEPGDAKILRNAGARVTDDVLRTLVLASYLLGVDRAMVIAHTD
jgi:hypothetical protein